MLYCPAMLGFPHHRIGALGAIGALIGLVAPSAAPAADPAEVASVVDHTDLRRQAAHYLGKGLVERARATVKAALLLPGALDDAKLQLLAAKVHLETGEIEQVFICLDRVDRSDDGDAKERAREVSERLRSLGYLD